MCATAACAILHVYVRRAHAFVGLLLHCVVAHNELLDTDCERVQPSPYECFDWRCEFTPHFFFAFFSVVPPSVCQPSFTLLFDLGNQNILHFLCLGFFCFAIEYFGSGSFVAAFDLSLGRPKCDHDGNVINKNFILMLMMGIHSAFWMLLLFLTVECLWHIDRKVRDQQDGQVSAGLKTVRRRFCICFGSLAIEYVFSVLVLIMSSRRGHTAGLDAAFIGGTSDFASWAVSSVLMMAFTQLVPRVLPCFIFQHLMGGSPWSSNVWSDSNGTMSRQSLTIVSDIGSLSAGGSTRSSNKTPEQRLERDRLLSGSDPRYYSDPGNYTPLPDPDGSSSMQPNTRDCTVPRLSE